MEEPKRKAWVVMRGHTVVGGAVFGFYDTAKAFRDHCAAWVTRNVDNIRLADDFYFYKPIHDPGLNCRGSIPVYSVEEYDWMLDCPEIADDLPKRTWGIG